MTKHQYFELCESIGSNPIEEEIPVDYDELPATVQLSFTIYEALRDEWEYMGGKYIGKNLQNLFQVLDLYEIPTEERLLIYKILSTIDNERKAIIRSKNKDT